MRHGRLGNVRGRHRTGLESERSIEESHGVPRLQDDMASGHQPLHAESGRVLRIAELVSGSDS